MLRRCSWRKNHYIPQNGYINEHEETIAVILVTAGTMLKGIRFCEILLPRAHYCEQLPLFHFARSGS